METKTPEAIRARLVSNSVRILPFILLLALSVPNAQADPVSELASFSIFPKVDLAQLSKGDAKPVRGGSLGNARYLFVQTVYVAPHPPEALLAKMRSWNPARHPDLKVFVHVDSATNFSRLQNPPDNSAVRDLTTATSQNSSDLQLSAAERKLLPGENFASVWTKILSARAQAGPAGQPPYDNVSPPVRPGDELNALLRGNGKIGKQFAGVNSGRGDTYWELLSADERGVLALGAYYSRTGAGGSIQTANTRYYASGGYYAGATLHQLWPVQVEGRASTLVWRGDMISSASVGALRGIERIAAESTMIKDVSRAVSLFRRDTGSAR